MSRLVYGLRQTLQSPQLRFFSFTLWLHEHKAGLLPQSGLCCPLISNGTMNFFDPPTACRAFVSLYTTAGGLPTTVVGRKPRTINLLEHVDPATPEVDGWHFRYFITHPTAFPFWPQGRLLQLVYEAACRFTCVTACSLAVWKLTTPRYHDAASSCYRGVRTTPRTGL